MPNVLVEEKDRTTIVTLNRPERRNALTIELMSELADALDNDQRRSAKSASLFCAGRARHSAPDSICRKPPWSKKRIAPRKWWRRPCSRISQTRLITIAQVHGAAVAGGAGLMSACDFVVAAERTKIGYPETKRGLVAGLVMTFLRRQLRERDIRELLFTGDLISAERAREIGLVNRVVPREELENETTKIVASIRQNAPDGAREHQDD